MPSQIKNTKSKITNPLLDDLANNSRGHFERCSYFSMSLRGEDYPYVLYVKPGNKVYILNVLKQITTDYFWADKKPVHTILLKKKMESLSRSISQRYIEEVIW